jgi:hypothetical protein
MDHVFPESLEEEGQNMMFEIFFYNLLRLVSGNGIGATKTQVKSASYCLRKLV